MNIHDFILPIFFHPEVFCILHLLALFLCTSEYFTNEANSKNPNQNAVQVQNFQNPELLKFKF